MYTRYKNEGKGGGGEAVRNSYIRQYQEKEAIYASPYGLLRLQCGPMYQRHLLGAIPHQNEDVDTCRRMKHVDNSI